MSLPLFKTIQSKVKEIKNTACQFSTSAFLDLELKNADLNCSVVINTYLRKNAKLVEIVTKVWQIPEEATLMSRLPLVLKIILKLNHWIMQFKTFLSLAIMVNELLIFIQNMSSITIG